MVPAYLVIHTYSPTCKYISKQPWIYVYINLAQTKLEPASIKNNQLVSESM